MLDIVANGSYYAEVDTELADLRADIQPYCRERFRRIDRFTQLCLLGSGRCVEQLRASGLDLSPQAGLYIGSRYASLANTVNVHRDMISGGHIPKPAYFINTLSNSAAYYVARNLQMGAKNLFISRADASLEASLHVIDMDLAAKAVPEALLGIVEEGVLPLAEQRQRLGVSADTKLAEGSHWLLLRPSGASAQRPLATITELPNFYDLGDVQHWLQQQVQQCPDTQIFCNTLQRPLLAELHPNAQHYSPNLRYYPGQTAAALLHFISQAKPGAVLITFYGDSDNRFYLSKTIRR